MKPLDSSLLSSFEEWAGYNGYNLKEGGDDNLLLYECYMTQAAWEAYKEATRKLLESLVIGVEATKEGAAVCLMAKVKDVTLVVKSQYVVADKPVIGRMR